MKWNTQRKSVVAVLALAGAAFCVDRFVLGYAGPRAAAAQTTTSIIAPAPATSEAAPIRAIPLAKRVGSLIRESPGPDFPATFDALCIPASWSPLLREPEPLIAPSALSSASPAAETPSFSISSVFLGASPKTTAARIDNKLIRVGQSIRGHQLLRIEHGSPAIVVLSGPAGELRLPFTIGGTNANPGADDAPTTSPTRPG